MTERVIKLYIGRKVYNYEAVKKSNLFENDNELLVNK